MTNFRLSAARLGVAFVLLSALAFAQTERGTIRGTVEDISGATIADAAVSATNDATGVVTETVSTAAGVYQIPQVRPGTYTVRAEFSGFKTFVRENVRVGAGAIIPLDLAMEVGDVSESVTVSAAAITLKTESTEVSTDVNPKSFVELPLQVVGGSGRAVEAFIFLAPGTSGDTFDGHINGSQSLTKEIQMDGMSMTTAEVGGDPRVLLLPPEAVQEFSLLTNNYPAEYGNSGGGVERLVVRSGGNEFHGNGYEFLRNDKMDASGFFASKRSIQRRNEYGFSVGGPIIKNRTFFFTNWHWYKFRAGATNQTGSLPTPAIKAGDFSELIPAGEGVIYDPATTRQVGSGFVRDPFPGNVIPNSRHSGISTKVWDLVPNPDGPGLFNNFFATGNRGNNNRNNTNKLDHNITDAHRISMMYTYGNNKDLGPFSVLPGPITDARAGVRGPRADNGRINYDWIIGPTVLFHMGAGISRQDQLLVNTETEGAGWNEKLGIRGTENGPFPEIIIDPWNSYGRHQRGLATISTTYLYNPSLSWTKGKHSFKFGGEVRKLQNNLNLLPHTGNFTFNRLETGLPGVPGTGNVLASFLLGEVDSGHYDIRGTTGTRHSYTGVYAQDDYKIRSNVTLNLGLRYDIFTPMTEVNNKMSIVDPNLPNPGADGFPGALVFAGDCDVCTGTKRLVGNDSTSMNNFGPRLGLAWKLNDKLVFRSAYAISYFTTGGLGGGNAKAPIAGFSARPRFFSSNLGVTPGFNWEDGFPQDFKRPPLREPDFSNGQRASIWNHGANEPMYMQSFNAGFQYQLAPTWLVDMSWVGNKSTRLSTGVFNPMQVDPQFLRLGNLLTLPIDSPQVAAAGYGRPYASFSGTLNQALRRFPQYSGLNHTRSEVVGNSTYHSLQIKVEKEFEKGLWMLSSYTWAKALTDSSSSLGAFFGSTARDDFNRGLEKSLARFDVPHRFVVAFNYELPFGRGKTLGSGVGAVANAIIGGWQLNAILNYQSGTPSEIGQNNASPLFASRQVPNILSSNIDGRGGSFDPATDKALNIGAFGEVGPFEFGNGTIFVGGARNFPRFNEDFGLMKRIYATEDINVELRFEVFNAFNRVVFGGAAGNVSNPASFGSVGGQGNPPRSGQVALKVNF